MVLTPICNGKQLVVFLLLGWLISTAIFAVEVDRSHTQSTLNTSFASTIEPSQGQPESAILDSISSFRQLAFTYANEGQPEQACVYIKKYIKANLDPKFVGHSTFDKIKEAPAYRQLADTYLIKIDAWPVFVFNVGFIGLFIAVVLNLRKRSDRTANLLMSVFVFQHSIFMLHVSLRLSNYWYYLPHTLYSSTIFSFLYGPLIYFYFKRVSTGYRFKIIDLLHVLPTVVLGIGLIPIYVLSGEEKLAMLLLGDKPISLYIISIGKLISLMVYGVLVLKIYLDFVKTNKNLSKTQYQWQHTIAVFCLLYIITYSVYSFLILTSSTDGIGLLHHIQVALMAGLVLYVSYTAFVYPSIFGNLEGIKTREKLLHKYEKSGLTESLSLELKDKLQRLLTEDHIYRDNSITLHKLAQLLDTTRHNTSQIINEHFGLNFFDLVNTYRIQEAMSILRDERSKHIIDVAYEVGFNNKVTFNKSFKKYNQITPTEFVKSLVA